MFGRSGWLVSLFVLSFLSPSGPMCVALASTHTAVQAGRLCQEGTSVLFVSSSLLKVSWSDTTKPRRRRRGMILFLIVSSRIAEDVKTQMSQLNLLCYSPLLLSSNLQEFMWRWLLFQTQHVHLFEWPALSQLWIRSRRSVTYVTYMQWLKLDQTWNPINGIEAGEERFDPLINFGDHSTNTTELKKIVRTFIYCSWSMATI